MKRKTSISHDEAVIRELRDNPRFAVEYLRAALEDESEPCVLLIALRRVVQARGIAKIAKTAGVERESLYRALSKHGNPRLSTLAAVTKAVGLRTATLGMTPASGNASVRVLNAVESTLAPHNRKADLRRRRPGPSARRLRTDRSCRIDEARGRGKAVFVPFVLAEEKIEASLTEQKPGFARAQADSIIEPSPHRIQPACPHFTRCGGCHYQHASYEHQLEIKKEILRESLRRTGQAGLALRHRSPSFAAVELSQPLAPASTQSAPHSPPDISSWPRTNCCAVEECPISSPLINRGIASLWQSGRAGKVPAGVREVEFFANADDTQLLIDVGCAREARRAAVRDWAEDFRAAMPEIAGVVAFREPNPGDRKARRARNPRHRRRRFI